MTTVAIQSHLVRDDQNVLRLGGLKYIMFVSNHVYYDMDVAALQKQYPSLSREQIHAGLAYYYENKAELDAELKRREQMAEEFFRNQPDDSAFREKLLARKAQIDAAASEAKRGT